MPTIKDFETKKKKTRRRPSRENKHERTEHEVQDAFGLEDGEELEAAEQESTSQAESKKVHIEFPYSDLIRAKVPKAFEVAETVATDWVNNGTFENVPVGHPVAQMTVAAGLRKAKEVEKKLEEKGVFMMAKMGLAYAKSKIKR